MGLFSPQVRQDAEKQADQVHARAKAYVHSSSCLYD